VVLDVLGLAVMCLLLGCVRPLRLSAAKDQTALSTETEAYPVRSKYSNVLKS
jgi:hypothetical protein